MSFERPDDTNTSNAGADSNYLSKQTYVQKHPGSLDSAAVFYHFDGQKRVISYAWRDLVAFNPADVDSLHYFYHGNDSLPFKEIQIRTSPGLSDTSERYMFFNVTGKLVLDSVIRSSLNGGNYTKLKGIANYSYNADKIYIESHQAIIYDPTGSLGLYTSNDTITLDPRGNAIKLRLFSHDEFGNISNNAIHTLSYDLKPSASRKLNINNIFPVNIGADYQYDQLGFKNNLTSWKEEFPGLPPNLYYNFGQYTYLNSGFPSIWSDAFSPDEYEKFYYQYRSF